MKKIKTRPVTAVFVSKRLSEPYNQYDPRQVRSMATVGSNREFSVIVDASGSGYQGNPHFIYFREDGYTKKTPIIGFSIREPEIVIPDFSRILAVSKYDLELVNEWLAKKHRKSAYTNWEMVIWEWNRECQNMRRPPMEYEDMQDAYFDGYYDSNPEELLCLSNRFVPSTTLQPNYAAIVSEYVRR